ncbi:MAG: 1,4-alpha-glucan branching enzyme, partial [Gammaproteobacteria bacterium]|nr:1,4-alpha-glucan branching enzyme [Gammaproteobacteria bacterium]
MTTLEIDIARHKEAFAALVAGRHHDPFSMLGVHRVDGDRVVRTLQPHAERVELIDRSGRLLSTMQRLHPDGLFAAIMPPRIRRYRFRITTHAGDIMEIDDCYAFGQTLGDVDLYLLAEGSDRKIYQKLGAHPKTISGVCGTRFAVWAPNASRVSVVGDFNDWDGRRHVMRLHPANGIWEVFVPGVPAGTKYKYELLDQQGKLLPQKTDPFAGFHESPPGNASLVYESSFAWADDAWMQNRSMVPKLDRPVSIYEVHLGSWRRKLDPPNSYLNYRELADELVSYVVDMGFTHVELLPVTEHP